MTRTQFNLYKKTLDSKSATLYNRPGFRDEITVERVPDTLEAIRDAEDRYVAIRKLDQRATELAEIRTALDRIAEGSYGRCLACEAAIPVKRLNAVPWAAHCVKCQESVDRSGQSPVSTAA